MELNSNDIACYTVIFGDYDVLFTPTELPDSVDYICFTDNSDLTSDIWEIREVDTMEPTHSMSNRRVKILAHEYLPEYEYSVYIDGNIQVTGDLTDLVKNHLSESEMACPRHTERDCVYEEGSVCISENIGKKHQIQSQMERYRKEGYPENDGLSDNSVLIRKHNHTNIIALMQSWWKELQSASGRDQLSLPYVSWKTGIEYEMIDEGPRNDSEYFRKHPHKPHGWLAPILNIWLRLRERSERNAIYKTLYQVIRRVGLRLGIEYR